MATRTDARISVVSVLFAYDSGNENIAKNKEAIYEENKIKNKQKEFADNLVSGVMENLVKIDALINSRLKDWDYDRIGKVDKAILRLGTYEIAFTDTDKAVIINEALNMAKTLCADESPKFINGLLDKINKGD
ncbi:MAG: transcription antitermination protein NusB [Campylobacterota bacterium]|nr:transcription antitermination protein NusB [Campylobacterota bacterium]